MRLPGGTADTATMSITRGAVRATPRAVLRAAPNPSTDGSYTVSGTMNATAPNSHLKYQMIETGPGSARNTFSVADPNVAELAAAQTWPLSTQLKVALEDVNVDGVWDAFVTGVSGTSGFAGAVDQIVVSPATAGAKPTGLVAVDDDLKSFIDSVMAWYRDLDHFDTTVTVTTRVLDGTTSLRQLLNVHLEDCNDEWGSCYIWRGKLADYYGGTAACVIALASSGIITNNTQGQRVSRVHVCETVGWSFFGVAQVGHTIVDFGSVSEGAVEHVADFVNIWEAGESDHEPEDLADVLESILEIMIGGDLDERLDEVQQSLLNLHALFGAQGRGTVDIPANSVIVTRRRVVETDSEWKINGLNWHAALEWTVFDSEDRTWLSGNPTIAAYQRSGMLKSERNHPSERNNLYSGTVSATGLPSTVSIWLALSRADRKYCDSLDYRWPWERLATDEYNSNGFAAGIIGTINGMTDAPIGTYLFGQNPVPAIEFRREMCN